MTQESDPHFATMPENEWKQVASQAEINLRRGGFDPEEVIYSPMR
jgi:hypothetical protein